MCVIHVCPSIGLLKERNAEVGQLMGEKAALERELEKLKEQVSRVGWLLGYFWAHSACWLYFDLP